MLLAKNFPEGVLCLSPWWPSDSGNTHHLLIGSLVRHTSVLDAIKTLGADRVSFGSDTPFALMHVCVAEYNALLDGEVTPEEKNQIMGGNLLRLLGLPA